MSNLTNNYYKIRAKYYNSNGDELSVNALDDVSVYSDYSAHIDASMSGGAPTWMSGISVEYTGNEYDSNDNTTGGIKIGEGFNCIFRTDSNFEECNGYNGCIGFAWTKNSFGSEAVPEKAYGANYSTRSRVDNPGYQFGLWSDMFREHDFNGISLTLYPETTHVDNNGNVIPTLHQLTTKISRFELTFCNDSGLCYKYERYLPECIDVCYENSLSVEHSFGKYNFYLNGKLFASIEDSYTNIDTWNDNEGYFTAAFVSSQNLDARLEIKNVSYCPEITETTTTNEEVNTNE